MNKLLPLTYIVLFFAFKSLTAQNYPYLNASTGNEGQYIVDADTNIYMFHGNQLEKVDKNLNPIWVKTYTGMDFYSLLLSKTGSIYFIARDQLNYSGGISSSYIRYAGKLDNTGNMAWIKTIEHPYLTDINLRGVLLDRNNHLIISGEGTTNTNSAALLMKLDTMGNILHNNYFTGPQPTTFSNVTILNDSAGYYKCICAGNFFESSAIVMFTYCEAGDSIYSEAAVGEYLQFYMIRSAGFYKSNKNPDVYYSITQHGDQGPPQFINIRKYDKNNVLWNKKFPAFYGSDFTVNSFDENADNSVFFTIAPYRGPGYYHTNYYNMCFKFDSNGVFNGHYNTLLSYSWWPPSSQPEAAKLTVLNNNKLIYDVIGNGFPSNPLSVTFLDSTLTTNCSTPTALTMTTGVAGPIQSSSPLLTSYFTAPYVLADYTTTASVISDFTINPNYCLALSVNEIKPESISLYPNPSRNYLTIKLPVEQIINNISVFDVNGKQVLSDSGSNTIDISKLNPGLYFIKIKTGQGEFSRKFIKE